MFGRWFLLLFGLFWLAVAVALMAADWFALPPQRDGVPVRNLSAAGVLALIFGLFNLARWLRARPAPADADRPSRLEENVERDRRNPRPYEGPDPNFDFERRERG